MKTMAAWVCRSDEKEIGSVGLDMDGLDLLKGKRKQVRVETSLDG